MSNKQRVKIVGGGLAGCEAAFQLLERGYGVDMHEMRPEKNTGAHSTDKLAELVCSNSLKSEGVDTASATLKDELDVLGCRLLKIARENSVPSGSALAVDRMVFSLGVERDLRAYEDFNLIRGEVTYIPDPPVIIATGPLTSPALTEVIRETTGSDKLYFYDAIAPIVDAESIDYEHAYFAGRYGRGEDDYLNLPMERDEYEVFYEALINAETVGLRDFEKKELFEGCMPIEEIARRGKDAMRFGPLRPIGLKDPRTGRGAYAVVQLRREHAAGDCYNLVGFQTNLTYKAQKEVFSLIPALRNAEFLRFGVMHRNTYIGPQVLKADFSLKSHPGRVYVAGQLSGVEGYVESIMSGLMAAVYLTRHLEGKEIIIPPQTTITGALLRYISECGAPFQPMNANFGLLPIEEGLRGKDRKKHYRERAVCDIIKYNVETGFCHQANAH